MALFLSTFINKIDAKGRVSVPSQFRSSLVNKEFSGVVIYESFVNDCIEGCDIERIKQISESIDNLDPFSQDRDALATALLGGSTQLAIDAEGRIIIPENLLKKAKIKDQALFVGKGVTFEIWQPQRFEEYMSKSRADAKTKLDLVRFKK
ncbi:MAG: cell division/cell wall cluster transcriptional repressor MraZ [Rickettsiales bacterium]|nr:cell division/cell wall cluster transcriptional repressor MraZ [Rickettsiales bacterium]